ncbi:MAG: hypothetical protein HC904_14570 [Blastochloris sp.]|nr:hypothetical protein [Blastochloris sp.]
MIVPTAESGRRLRNTLLRLSPGAGLLLPRILTPAQFLHSLNPDSTQSPPLRREERLLIWTQVLLETDLRQMPELFPSLREEQDLAWHRSTASLLLKTQDQLMENGWTMDDMARSLSLEFDKERWLCLARLELSYRSTLLQSGRQDPSLAWTRLLQEAQLPQSLHHLALLATPDPLPALIRFLDSCRSTVDCHVGIHAPETESESFDAWGRPRTEFWNQAPLFMESETATLHLSLTEPDQARRAASLAAQHQDHRAVAIALGRDELQSLLESELRARQLQPFHPGGLPSHRFSLWSLLDRLEKLLSRGSFHDLVAWLQHPGSRAWLQQRIPNLQAGSLLQCLDQFQQKRLPQHWHEIAPSNGSIAFPHPAQEQLIALKQNLNRLLQSLTQADWTQALRQFLDQAALIQNPNDLEAHAVVRDWLDAQESFRLDHPELGPALKLSFFLEEWARQPLPQERPEQPIELGGWLELLWDERPHLILTGFQEGAIPGSVQGDPFLPESLRQKIGLRHNAHRLACDAYQLKALLEQRRRGGRVDVLLSKFNAEAEPLLPSRLLLLCPDAELPRRVHSLFHPPQPKEDISAPTQAFHLQPQSRQQTQRRISVTQFGDYLQSPYYLSPPDGCLGAF